MKVTAQYAATHLDDILAAAENGEEVRIDRPNKPGIRLVVETAPRNIVAAQTGRRILGAGLGEMRVPSEQEWDAMDKQLERQMNDSPLLTSGEV
jgi:antitoxin (DNA-binding transcriptional repressor) of toxin-antitoxin stability system